LYSELPVSTQVIANLSLKQIDSYKHALKLRLPLLLQLLETELDVRANNRDSEHLVKFVVEDEQLAVCPQLFHVPDVLCLLREISDQWATLLHAATFNDYVLQGVTDNDVHVRVLVVGNAEY